MDMAVTAKAMASEARPDLKGGMNRSAVLAFAALLAAGVGLALYSVNRDIAQAHVPVIATTAIILLGVALITAFAFEFVNGFHDTANAVATVIYTHALPPTTAVIWSGAWNFLGVLTASGAVAFGNISLLPVELILQADSGAGFAMVFALLIAAILWNLGTWYLGLPSSSSHTLIGSIIGVGVANQLMHLSSGTSGVDWTKASEIGMSLLISPIIGFATAALLFLAMKAAIKVPALYEAPKGQKAPPLWIRALLILTCTLVSFFHGSNDGQKGMGLIMLILIGTVPTAYALNRAIPDAQVAEFAQTAATAQAVLTGISNGVPVPQDPRAEVKRYLQTRKLTDETLPALAYLTGSISDDAAHYVSLAKIPVESVTNIRNDMYMVSEALRIISKSAAVTFDADGTQAIGQFKAGVDAATRFIPTWVKVCVAIALGLGTMVGWKRIVVTVGEKIGKTHLTYAQGAAAELVAATTIGVADAFGLPVSTTHVLSSGVAGTMAANGSGLQMSTLRNLAIAWVLTLPASMLLAGFLYYLFSAIF